MARKELTDTELELNASFHQLKRGIRNYSLNNPREDLFEDILKSFKEFASAHAVASMNKRIEAA